MTPLIAQTQPPTLNLVFFGDSLTEGVLHFNGETDTMLGGLTTREIKIL